METEAQKLTKEIEQGFEKWFAGHKEMIGTLWTGKEAEVIKAAMLGAYMEGAMQMTLLFKEKLKI